MTSVFVVEPSGLVTVVDGLVVVVVVGCFGAVPEPAQIGVPAESVPIRTVPAGQLPSELPAVGPSIFGTESVGWVVVESLPGVAPEADPDSLTRYVQYIVCADAPAGEASHPTTASTVIWHPLSEVGKGGFGEHISAPRVIAQRTTVAS